MNTGTFSVAVERERALVVVRMAGMLTVADTHALVTEMIGKITAARFERYAVIIDVSCCPVQSQDMIGAMAQHLVRMERAHALAVVTGTMLARLQVRRLFSQPFARFTTTYAEALDWVVSGIDPDAPAATSQAG